MSTSNNLEEKPLLQYIVHAMGCWGIPIDDRLLRGAKKNDPSSLGGILDLLTNLSLLHLIDYRYRLSELQVDFGNSEREMKELVMGYLFETGCPLLVRLGSNPEG